MNKQNLTLISHELCPFVQRSAIVLKEKNVEFVRKNVDLANKPDWFKALSPLGKVPLLLVNNEDVLFESAPIAEYVNQITGGGFLSKDPLKAARQRAWVEFSSALITNIGQFYNAPDDKALAQAYTDIHEKLGILEKGIAEGPMFSGKQFSLVDAAFAPTFRYFPVLWQITGIQYLGPYGKIKRWWETLRLRPSVQQVVTADFDKKLIAFIAERDSVVGKKARLLQESTLQVA